MKNRWLSITMVGLLLGGMIVLVELVRPLGSMRKLTDLSSTLAQLAQAVPAQLAGDYSGRVNLALALSGVYSDTLATPPPPAAGTPEPPELGSIDLSLQIGQIGNALNGYVSLDKTLVFSVEHTLQDGSSVVKIGPFINGTFDGTNLVLHSERISSVVSGRNIERQFRLTGAISRSDGSEISGEYRETLWGYTRQPITVLGTFTLQRTVFDQTVLAAGNSAPDAIADTATTTQGAAVTINALANDLDADGDALTVTSVSKPQFGTTNTDGQSITYTPNADFVGVDSFTYFITDGRGGSAAGSVTVTVNGVTGLNQQPTVANDSAMTTQGTPVVIDVLGNDSDPDGDALTITLASQPSNGTATVDNEAIVYTPTASFVGTDTFTYKVSDGKGGMATATVTVTVMQDNPDDPDDPDATNSLYLPFSRRQN